MSLLRIEITFPTVSDLSDDPDKPITITVGAHKPLSWEILTKEDLTPLGLAEIGSALSNVGCLSDSADALSLLQATMVETLEAQAHRRASQTARALDRAQRLS